jgi:hypothetical protein
MTYWISMLIAFLISERIVFSLYEFKPHFHHTANHCACPEGLLHFATAISLA